MLADRVNEELKTALKSGDKIKVSVLRMLNSEIKNKKIADGVESLEDEKIIGLVQKMVKQHKESIKQFKEGNREDLVEKESAELVILEEYLPEQISEEELEGIVSEAIKSVGADSAKDMGKVMKEVMSKVQGRADGKTISEIAKKKLS